MKSSLENTMHTHGPKLRLQLVLAGAPALAMLSGSVWSQSIPPTDPPYPSDGCTSVRAIEAIMNGSFERVVPCATLGTSLPLPPGTPLTPVDGNFWVGAEGMTALETNNRFLRFAQPSLMNSRVYQRIPAVEDAAGGTQQLVSGLTATLRSRVASAQDEAWVSVSEADGEHYTFGGFLYATNRSINYRGYPAGSSGSACTGAPAATDLTPNNSAAIWKAVHETKDASCAPVATPMLWYFPYAEAGCWQPQPLPQGTFVTEAIRRTTVTFFSPPATSCAVTSNGLPACVDTLFANGAHVQVGLAPALAAGCPDPRGVRVAFEAPRAGAVRIGARFFSPAPGSADARVQILHWPAGTPLSSAQLLRDFVVRGGDEDGLVTLDRIAVNVDDQILFRFSNLQTNVGANLFCNPTVVYEGRRVTYRLVTPQNMQTAPVSINSQEVFQTVVGAAAGAWSTANVTPGALWNTIWPSQPPRPPLELELSARPSNTGSADFDDVSVLSPMCDATPTQLAQAVEAHLAWQREIHSRNRDNNDHPLFPGNQIGPAPSPFTCYDVLAKTGVPVGAFSEGEAPRGALERLQIDLDLKELADLSWITQQSWYRRYPATGYWAGSYNCSTDQWLVQTLPPNPSSGCDTTSLPSIGEALRTYALTRDVTLLDLVAVTADHAVKNGVRLATPACGPTPWWHELIAPGEWSSCAPTAPPQSCTEPQLLYALEDTAAVVAAYVALKSYELDTGTNRFSAQYNLGEWGKTALASVRAVQRGFDVHFGGTTSAAHCSNGTSCNNPAASSPNPNWWSYNWHQLPASLNDMLGYLGGAASVHRGLDQYIAKLCGVAPTALEPVDLELQCTLESLVRVGVDRILDPWHEALARGEFNGGDQVRGWVQYFDFPTERLNCDTTFTARQQLVDAASYFLKLQYPVWRAGSYLGVTWLNTSQDPMQLPEIAGYAGQPGLAPAYYLEGLVLALSLATPAPLAEVRKDLRAALYTMLRTTRLRYREDYTLNFGFAARPRGFPGYSVNIDTLQSGLETRAYDRLVEGVALAGWQAFGASANRPKPGIAVSPANSVPAPTNPVFTVTLTVPTGGSTQPTALASMWTNRTQVGWWREVVLGGQVNWEYQQLWPNPPAGWTVIANTNVHPVVANITAPAGMFSSRTLKFEARTWEATGAWAQDMSFQKW